ncbi:MAG: broad specificity phosphatase PhoE [Alphaproteobacteria bacterium]|jgi:broad specificity phosphatase PhoE
MWIYLTRHAETDGNVKRVVQTPDTPLSSRGERQAQQFADAYSQLPISSILSSDYGRTHATALKLHDKLNRQFVISELLRERNFGDLRGKAYDDIPTDIFALDYHPPGGESYTKFVARIREAWQQVIKVAKGQEGDLLVMTHGLVVRCILTEILTLSPQVLAQTDIQNTSVTKISADDHANIPLLCDITHLSEEALTQRE